MQIIKSAKFMMFQTEYKHFNKKIKILLLLFLILMWSLTEQHVYSESSTTDMAIVAVAATATTALSAAEEFGYDTNTNGRREMMQEKNMAEITTTNDATKNTNNRETITTIYGHINENDNNSNKLPQNVAKKGPQQQPNMMYMNKKMPASAPALSSQSQSTTSSTTTVKAIRKTATTTTAVAASLPPTESLLMPKDQLNKTEYSKKIPKSPENENEPEDCKKEGQILEVKLNDTRANKAVENSSNSNSNSNDSNNIDNVLTKNINYETTESNQHESPKVHKIAVQVEKKNSKNYSDPQLNKKNSQQFETFDSIAHAQQELMAQFALRFKQIPRVTYFTCKASSRSKMKKTRNQKNANLVEFLRRLFGANAANSPMIKIVLMDQLAKEKRGSILKHMAWLSSLGEASGASTRSNFTNINWLEKILPPEPLRQIVVLNLSCGTLSLRLLEMASNKAFFNSMYHWLLLLDEDYVFKRQTEIDDADDDIESKMCKNNKSYICNTTTTKVAAAAKTLKEEIVNDSNDAVNLQVKKLSTYPADVVGASTSGLGPRPDKQNNVLPTNSASTSFSTFKIAVADKSSLSASLNASRARITNEDDTEIIEKFLGKLNININTELILAKRRMRAIMLPNPTTTPPPPPPSSSSFSTTNSTSTDSIDYNTLQKMDYYLLYDVWSPGLQYGGLLNITKIGYFSRGEGFKLDQWYRTTSTIRRRSNMHLAQIRCLVVITHKNNSDSLEEYLTSHYDTHLDSMNRFNFALLTHVRDLFNFSFILSKTSTWGYLKNGKFDGMIGALVRKQADIGGSPIFFRIERAKVIDYTARTWVARPCFIFRHPRSTGKERIVFLQPFSDEVWIFLFICGFFTTVLLWILTSLERKFINKNFYVNLIKGKPKKSIKKSMRFALRNNGKKKLNINIAKRLMKLGARSGTSGGLFFEALVFYIGSMCQQGLPFSTFFISGRCIVVISLLFSFAIYQFYSASIVGTLLMEKPKTIRTLRDLMHSSLEIGIEDIVYNRDYFLRTKDPIAKELYARKVTTVPRPENAGFFDSSADNATIGRQIISKTKAQPDILTRGHGKTKEASNWYDPNYGLEKVKMGHFAFHVDVATAYKIIADTFSEKEICELAEVQLFEPQKMVNIVQKGSPLRKIITYGLRRVTETGLTDYQRKVWHSARPRCVKQLHTDDLKVDMQTFTSALLVLIFGYAVSLLILSLEIVHFKLWQRYTTLRT